MCGEAAGTGLGWWRDASEIVKNLFTLAALGGAAWAWYRWRTERFDRATEVLFKLQERFDGEKIRAARRLLENDARYAAIEATLRSEAETGPSQSEARSSGHSRLDDLDEMLRFYVFVYAVRQAGQVPRDSLSTCFRFWLAHYFNPQRHVFRLYVDRYFPTLKRWLGEDPSFFAANEFWPDAGSGAQE